MAAQSSRELPRLSCARYFKYPQRSGLITTGTRMCMGELGLTTFTFEVADGEKVSVARMWLGGRVMFDDFM